MAALRSVDQLGFDEQTINDPDLIAALEARENVKERLSEVRKTFNEATEKANGEIAKLELPEGGIVRAGRFRVTRTAIPAKVVSFETAASSRVRIAVVDDDE